MTLRLQDEYFGNLSLVYKMKISLVHAEARSSRSSDEETASRSETLVKEYKRLKHYEKKWIATAAKDVSQSDASFL